MAQERWATKMGPNDARIIVWAVSKFFIIFFHVLLILTILLIFLRALGRWQWRKQAQMMPDVSFEQLDFIFVFN